MSDDFHTVAYIDGEQARNIRDDLNEYGDDPTMRIKIKVRGSHPGAHLLDYALQACTDTDGGDDENNSHPCPGSPGC